VSAMPATELTCDSDIDLVRALRSVGVLSGSWEDDPGDTPGPQPTTPAPPRDTPAVRHAASTSPRDTPAAQSIRPGDTPVAPLRLTRRGRVVVAMAAAGDEQRAVPARGPGEPRPGDRPPGPEPVVGGRERGSRPGHPRRHPADHRPQFAERRHRVRRPAALGPARISPQPDKPRDISRPRDPRHSRRRGPRHGVKPRHAGAQPAPARRPGFPRPTLAPACLRPSGGLR
jgi:hypothetical protein